MSQAESMSSRSYEVRCARCDVSFPVGTKRCVHCGGATGAGRSVPFGSDYDSAYQTEDEGFVFRDEAEPSTMSTGPGESVGTESASPVRSLLRSMGGVIWVLLLVGFSLARSCGGE